MEPFKNKFNKNSVSFLANQIQEQSKDFKKTLFLKDIFLELDKLELKDRVELISKNLNKYLTKNYNENIKILLKTLSQKQDKEVYQQDGIEGFLVWPYTRYVANYGQDHFDESLAALIEMSKRFTSEFAIRYFLMRDYKKTMQFLKSNLNDPSHHTRRLICEGTRPNLPWGLKVSKINDNLAANKKILLKLQSDESLYVRKSVANHLNDISRLDKNLFFQIIDEFKKGEHQKWIIKKASRSLLKKGDPKALQVNGLDPHLKLDVNFEITPKKIQLGECLNLKLKILSRHNVPKKVLIQYAIHYVKKNNEHSRKVFFIAEKTITKELHLDKKIPLKKVTTREHYPGDHYLDIQINGTLYQRKKFNLSL